MKSITGLFRFIFVCTLFMCASLFAQEAAPAVAQIDYAQLIMDLVAIIKNFKVMGPMASISALLVIIMQLLKRGFVGQLLNKKPLIKALVIVVLGQISAILVSLVGGVGIWDAIVHGLISSSGAMAIYSVAKPLFLKKK